jgi:hypothetical protein
MWRASFTILLAAVAASAGATVPSALKALNALPPEQANRLVRIAACEGSPDPDRWHFVVYDPTAENGFSDFVVSGDKIVGRNKVSQFASSVRPEDVVGAAGVRVDSDRVAQLAWQFATANHVAVSSFNYEMRKDAIGVAPVWKVVCLDQNGNQSGWLVVDAAAGQVIAHGGFPEAAMNSSLPPPPVAAAPELDPAAEPVGGFHPPTSSDKKTKRPPERKMDDGTAADNEPPSDRPVQRSRPIEVRRAIVVEPAEQVRRAAKAPFRIFRGLFDN